MKDYEVHPRGTTEEIRLSRALANEIEQTLQQWGEVVPPNVRLAYDRLFAHYMKQIHDEEMQ